ncbi:uncharacterized protein LOC135821905 [Sycon ciliatum]|uniref:uncharacterized protein LOC135821905 n=1 Tax=Sycon ciliatum TaxID=27933 RepID=UPI0020AA3FD2|eukprot:scpid68563/ scgid10135/ MFS-type transporter SLC18B1; Solute carrier family 18 member B1
MISRSSGADSNTGGAMTKASAVPEADSDSVTTPLLKPKDDANRERDHADLGTNTSTAGAHANPLTANVSRARRFLIVACLCLTVASSAMQGTCFGPFFFKAALEKNPHGGPGYRTAVSAVFSLAAVASLVGAPVLIRVLHDIGSKQLLVIAACTKDAASILFAMLEHVSDWRVFLAYCYILRCIQGFGFFAIATANMTYLTRMYPSQLGFANSCMLTSLAAGHAVGTLLAGGLYDVGGFQLPFLVTGSIGLLMSLSAGVFILDIDKLANEQLQPVDQGNTSGSSTSAAKPAVAERHVSVLSTLRLPWVWFLLLLFVSINLAYSASEAVLAPHMKLQFGVSATVIGAALALMIAQTLICGPVVGKLLDRGWNRYLLMPFGLVLMAVGCVLIGPASFLHLPHRLSLVFVSTFVLGVGRVHVLLTLPIALAEHLRDEGLGSVVETRIPVAVLTRFFLSLGFALGPVVVSPLVAVLDFQTVFGLLAFLYCGLAALLLGLKWLALLVAQIKACVVRGNPTGGVSSPAARLNSTAAELHCVA